MENLDRQIPEFRIVIEAPVTHEQTTAACSSCSENFNVDDERKDKLKGCPFCLEKDTLYFTYSSVSVPTMSEIDDVNAILEIRHFPINPNE
jgi:hypothetical protein